MPSEERSLTETILRRDRWIGIAGLAAMTLLSWAYVVAGAGTGMSVWAMTSASLFPHRLGAMSIDAGTQALAWTPGYWVLMLLMWWVMMIAMMTPSAAPMILLFARASRHAQAQARPQPGAAPTVAFAGGYVLAWLGFSVAATVLMRALERAALTSPITMSSASPWLSAAILVSAGLYQLSPWKGACLQRCRHPADFIARHWKAGAFGALRMGFAHGVVCIGCCWALMALLFVGGMMNVLWIGILALFVILEKIVPRGPSLGWIGGLLLLAWGAVTLLF